jgi:O-acetylserine/cysteine efflux transporter
MNIKQILLAIIPPACWGSSYAFLQLGLKDIPPFFLLTISFTIAAIFLSPFLKLMTKDLPLTAFAAFVKIVLGLGCITLAQRKIDASTGAMLEQLAAPLTIILSAIFFKDYICFKKIIGIIMAFVGVVVISGEPSMPDTATLLYMLGAALFMAFTLIIVKKIEKDNGKITVKRSLGLNGWMCLFAFPFLAAISFIFETGQVEAISNLNTWGVIAIIYAGFINVIIASTIWYYLIGECNISSVVPFALSAPVFGLISGMFMLDETLSTEKVIGGLLIFSGVAIITIIGTDKGNRRHAKDLAVY